uniref:Smith-Magenis syndrome chromosome region, candidate 8b n=1 Tax=Scophthalmus maximus TaxID=52904 RepID=A0A8D3E819_SCOMX
MIGSPDLLAFTGTEGFGDGLGEEEQGGAGLPEELSVPLLPASPPWTSSARFHRDFVLVAEFSEQVGPKPVLTIPDDPRVVGSFDLNHFSVRLMSVDYQASGPVHDTFAYVHHVTLYDLEARGMVRPFCMAYVCSDQAKLMENFSELSACFSQASDSLKTGNRKILSLLINLLIIVLIFLYKISEKTFGMCSSPMTALLAGKRRTQSESLLTESHSLCFRYRRLTLEQETVNGFTDDGDKADDLDAVERSISTHRDLLRQVTSYPNRKLKQPDFLPYDPPRPSTSASSCRSERSLKSLQELCNAYFLSLMKDQLADTERRLRGDRSALRTARVSRSLSRKLALTNFLFEHWSAENEEEEEEEDNAEAEPPRGGEMFRAEPMSLESFYSCVEEIPIKLEAGEVGEDGAVSSDSSVVMEMTGSVSSGDSIEVLGTEKSYRTQRASVRRVATDAGARRGRAYARRANSNDSIEVLSTTESIFPDDLTAITEEEAEHQPLTGDVTPKWPEVHQPVRSVPDLRVNLPPPVAPPAEADRWTPPCAPLRLLSVDEASDCTSFTGSSDPPTPTQNVINRGHARCSDRRRRKAGLRALRFVKQNSFSHHALFCLLSGRPLVVIGGDQSLVRKLVDALSLFLPAPGPDGNAVTLCLSTPLQLTDLLTWRLIGIHRSPSGSSSSILHSLTRYSRYLALLDLDQRTLRCPSYSGSLVGRLADPRSGIGRGVTYLLHLESCLTALVNQALLYTFHGGKDGAGGRDFLLARGFCSSENDVRVVSFLSDLIRQRHAGRGPAVLRFSYCSVQLHRNTYTT